MKISSTAWIILSVSVAIGIIIMIAAFVIMRIKINKIKRETISKTQDIDHLNNKALERKNPGELLWDLKAKTKAPLQDEQLEFLINTAIRNEYKTFFVVNSFSNYENETFKKIAKINSSHNGADLIIIFNDANLQDNFDKFYKKLKSRQMIAIVNAPYKNKNIKELVKYLKLIAAKYDITPIGKGIVLVVK